MFVPKIWGFEDIAVNDAYCGKRMFVKEQHRCSIHKHANKDEVLMVGADGLVMFEYGDDPDKMVGIWMQDNDRIHIKPGLWHRFTALRDTVIYEFSTHHEDEDSIRHAQGGRIGDGEFRSLLSSFVNKSNKAKILGIGEAATIAAALRAEGKSIGMCNGCFDMMHLGHVELLMQAKNRCQALFVAVNSDAAVSRLKGPSRPIINEIGRTGMVASDRHVDYVVRAIGDTCVDVAEAIKPDVYITTSEYGNSGPEAKEVLRQGGVIEVVELLPGYSTTRISNTVLSRK